ncbi:MAG: cyanophycinase [Gemmatimonadota bacterium]
MRWSHSCGAVLSALFFALPSSSAAQQLGPPSGSLVIAGGNVHSATIFKRFLKLAGGPSAPIVVIPTAGGGDEYGPSFSGLRPFQDLGAVHLTVLHTRDREIADSEAFVRPLREARGVWFSGGRQWRLADAYLNTRTEKELWKVLERGGVIGGSSAGATIQGAYLVRGDTRTNTIMMGDHQQGFGFLKGTAIDQHVLKRNRQFDLIPVIEAHPDLLGIGLDENTAIVVHGDRFQVIGESYVAIYNYHEMIGDEGKFYFLAPGDAFDLVRRQALRTADVLRPLDRPAKREWSQP